MTGRVIIVTGANSGIGYRAAELLCEAGNDVILACRSEEKAKAALEKIFKKFPNALATFMQLDLGDLASIRKFVDDFHATEKKLHVLINNAGVYMMGKERRQFTSNNFEMMMGTNHLGPFLLTHLLLEDLKKTAADGDDADVRVINVTSSLHDPGQPPHRGKAREPLDMENFFLEKEGSYWPAQGYKNSKAAVVMFTYELARKLQDTGVCVNAMCPGYIPGTDLGRHVGGGQKFVHKFLMGTILRPVLKFVKTVDQGAKALVECAVKEDLKGVTGKYFKDSKEMTSSEESLKEDLQGQVYELSARYCHMEGYEPLDAPVPPPPEEPKPKSKKSKKEKSAAAEATPGPSGEGEEKEAEKDDKTAEEMKFADEEDKQEAAKDEEKKEEEKKEDDKKEETSETVKEEEETKNVEEKKEEKTEPAEEDDLKKPAVDDVIKKIEDTEITPAVEVAAQ